MRGPGSGNSVIAAICSAIIPGLGQLVQGRLVAAILHFVLAGALWYYRMGWLIHLWSALDAGLTRPPRIRPV